MRWLTNLPFRKYTSEDSIRYTRGGFDCREADSQYITYTVDRKSNVVRLESQAQHGVTERSTDDCH